jgi:hypothetical protein
LALRLDARFVKADKALAVSATGKLVAGLTGVAAFDQYVALALFSLTAAREQVGDEPEANDG